MGSNAENPGLFSVLGRAASGIAEHLREALN